MLRQRKFFAHALYIAAIWTLENFDDIRKASPPTVDPEKLRERVFSRAFDSAWNATSLL